MFTTETWSWISSNSVAHTCRVVLESSEFEICATAKSANRNSSFHDWCICLPRIQSTHCLASKSDQTVSLQTLSGIDHSKKQFESWDLWSQIMTLLRVDLLVQLSWLLEAAYSCSNDISSRRSSRKNDTTFLLSSDDWIRANCIARAGIS